MTRKDTAMPLINVKLIEGVYSASQKADIARSLTDAMVAIEGENLRSVTTCIIEEVKSGDWAVGGQCITTEAVRQLAAGHVPQPA
jgi:4-oxalocrotonate tautomerase